MKKFIFFILGLLLIGSAVSFYYYKRNIFSKQVLKLEILGPETIKTGEEIEYTVKYKNLGNTTLEEAGLLFEFPEDSVPIEEDMRVIRELENIYPGEERTENFKARVFGKKGEIKKAKATLSYRPKNLSAFFESKTSFSSKIVSVPLTFEIDSPSKVEIGKSFSFRINYFSKADYPFSDLRVKVEYPPGFEFLESKPSALEETEWDISRLDKTEGGRIEIKGKLEGAVKQEKIFKAFLGFWREGKFILLKEVSRGVEIVEPNLHLSYLVNGSPDYTPTPGELLHFEIFFRNIGQEYFEDLFLLVKLKGEGFDLETLRTERGDFQKEEGFVIWDWKQVPLLKFLGPREEGRVEFWIKVKEKWMPEKEKNPELKLVTSIAKVRETLTLKVNSLVEFEQLVFYEDERFENSGPIPPEKGKETSYTVVWKPKNYFNDLENVKVRATLPEYVSLTGNIKPEGAKLTFDSESREVVWNIGELKAGTGLDDSEKEVAFQIEFEPTRDLEGDSAVLISEAKLSGEDLWTKKTVEATAPEVDTTF